MQQIKNVKEIKVITDKQLLKKDIEKHLLRAEDDIKNNRFRDAREVFEEWKGEYGL